MADIEKQNDGIPLHLINDGGLILSLRDALALGLVSIDPDFSEFAPYVTNISLNQNMSASNGPSELGGYRYFADNCKKLAQKINARSAASSPKNGNLTPQIANPDPCPPNGAEQPLSQASGRNVMSLTGAVANHLPFGLSRCISCHVQGENSSAPPIPFDDETKMKAALLRSAILDPGVPLIDEISKKTDSGAMPIGLSLSTDQQKALKSYFHSLLGH